MSSEQSELIGKKLGTCTLQKLIGRGGMGEVYSAHQERPDRDVAVKILQLPAPKNSAMYRQFLARFQRESNLIARLEHINIMPIYEYAEQDGLAYLVMPYLTGGSLRDQLMKKKTLSPTEALHYLKQAAAALDYAHAHSVIHRDLKPDNFLLHADGRLILADFGIARILQDENDPQDTNLTGTGMLLGTPLYMAPEMISGQPVDHHADIYALGIILYQMLSGTVPFTGNTPVLIAAMHLQNSLPSLHATNPAIPVNVDGVLQIATAKAPQQRFPSAKALVDAFEHAISSPDMPLTLSEAPTSVSSHTPTILASTSGLSELRERNPYELTVPAFSPVINPPSSPSLTPSPPNVPSPYPSYPQTPYPPMPQKPQDRQPWFIVLSVVLISLLVVGGVLIGLQLNQNNNKTPTTQGSTPNAATTTASASATTIPQPTATSGQTTSGNVIPKGQVLYSSTEPGIDSNNNNCDGGSEFWTRESTNPIIACQPNDVIMQDPDTQSLAGIYLDALQSGTPYPTSNYVVEARIREDPSSSANFGLFFHNQAGQVGTYTFVINPGGFWYSYVYAPTKTQIASGSLGAANGYSSFTLDVVANSSLYTFYINEQKVGQVSDASYLSGTTGVEVGAGGTIYVNSFALYSLQ
jgi:serine/threonine protein kinase